MNKVEQNNKSIQEISTKISLLWLLMANLVGVLLAVLLLRPDINDWMSPFSYGRWIPLHMDWQLYGWCSLPLLGLIHRHFLGGLPNANRWALTGFSCWSIGLLAGGVGWLGGGSTGKLFLNWSGLAGAIFAAALIANWTILAIAWFSKLRGRKESGTSIQELVAMGIVLLGLVGVPGVLLYTSDPTVYPPVNPHSGGATGHSLLASTLSMVFLMGLLPAIVQLQVRDNQSGKWVFRIFWLSYLGSLIAYLLMSHGNSSNREWDQILGLGTLLVWPGLVILNWNRFRWDSSSTKWRWAFFFWWGMLVADGWLIFLPGMLDILKFTNALVAHSHLAMAGMLSSLNMLILIEMGPSTKVRHPISAALPFWLWNAGCLLYVVVMTLQGWREGQDPQVLFKANIYTEINYTIRLLAGGIMVYATMSWLNRILYTGMSAIQDAAKKQ